MIAATISRSPASEALPLCDSAKPATDRLPTTREQPERRPRPFAAAQHGEDRGRERQQPDEDDRMRRGDVLQRQRRQQREADDDAERHDGERAEIARAPGRFCAERPASSAAPSSAAITARADGQEHGVKSATAIRVAGSEPLKMITPMQAAAPSAPSSAAMSAPLHRD